MSEAREVRSVLDAAEQAAAASDYARAEQLLRDAADLQEASLGPLHPDLANTLNNLGIVCEITEKPIDAERYFRRAFSIATAVLEPEHPFVATSRKNLEDFCEARGIVANPPTPPPTVAPDLSSQPTGFADRPQEPSSHHELQPAGSVKWPRPLVIGAAALLLTVVGAVAWLGWNDGAATSSGSPNLALPGDSLPVAVPKENIGNRGGPVDTTPARGDAPPVAPPEREVRESSTPPTAPKGRASASAPLVAEVHLCSDLSTRGAGGSSGEWKCVPPSLPAGPGRLTFYTRIKSPTHTTVEHRWYRNERLFQAVELSIRANVTEGYRTYSRATVNSEGPAQWRVEVRTAEGVLLHSERFAVR